MKKRAAMLALALALILLCGNAMAEISGGGCSLQLMLTA